MRTALIAFGIWLAASIPIGAAVGAVLHQCGGEPPLVVVSVLGGSERPAAGPSASHEPGAEGSAGRALEITEGNV